jgi:hypothetical protein
VGRNPLLDLLAALLPSPERDELVRRGADPLVWSAVLGLVEFLVGGPFLISNAVAYIQELANANAELVLQMDPQVLASTANRIAITSNGPILWLTWAARPFTWLLASIPLVGIARLVAFGVSQDTVGEPLVWLPLRIWQLVRRRLDASRDRLRFGPERPDRVLREPGCDWVVLSCRPKADWNERVTIEIGERFYRVNRAEERQDGSFWAHAYLLCEAPDNEIIRALIRYEPP